MSDDTVFCGACGTALSASARFCTSCGTRQDDFEQEPATVQLPRETVAAAASPPPPAAAAPAGATAPPQAASPAPPPPPPASGPAPAPPRISERIEQVTPGGGEFAGQLAAQLNTPGVLVALTVAAASAAACFAVGLVLAIALPDTSLLSLERFGDGDVGVLTEAFGQMLSLLLVSFEVGDVTLHVGPLLFAAVPTLAAAATAAAQAGRTAGMEPWQRVAWGAAAGVPFVLAVAIALVAASSLNPSAGSAILLGLLWVGGGGALGTLHALRGEGVDLAGLLPARAVPALRTATAALVPLLLVLALTTVVGLAFFYVQALRDEPMATGDRSIPTTLVDSTLLSVDNGVNYAALGAGAKFEGIASPIPVDLGGSFQRFQDGFRIFDYSDAIPAYVFVPLLILLIGGTGLGALYSGFAVARRAGARSPGAAAAYGALTGPVWAIVAVIACAAHVKLLGHPDGDSVFVVFLLGGAALGALGGLLATGNAAPTGTAAPPSSAPPWAG